MYAQKKIEVNQSSLLSLKAELSRKRQEIHNAKVSDYQSKPSIIIKTKVKKKLDVANEGLSENDRKDAEQIDEENERLQKSQSALEVKSKLYEELVKNRKSGKETGHFLVDFENKEVDEGPEKTMDDETTKEQDDVESEYDFDDDEDWIDFIDCLGRTKRCHRDDIESMKASDEKLRISLFGKESDQKKSQANQESQADKAAKKTQSDLCSDDMRREALRQKWEEEERMLSDLKDIHYQHVLFDEARTHGVGYYHFSTDEAERARQMKDLNKMRTETLRQRAATREAATRKRKQMQERLKAARRRKRERLGLPLEEENEETVEEEEEEVEKPQELKRETHQSSYVRPWDIGKEKESRVLTQEEWIQRRREDRPKEFAPPRLSPSRKKKKESNREEYLPETYPEDRGAIPSCRAQSDFREKRSEGIKIPPPPELQVFPPASQPPHPSEIEKAIEEGLLFIRKQVEENQAKKLKGAANIF